VRLKWQPVRWSDAEVVEAALATSALARLIAIAEGPNGEPAPEAYLRGWRDGAHGRGPALDRFGGPIYRRGYIIGVQAFKEAQRLARFAGKVEEIGGSS
jgi:hypothetical protein